LIGGEGVLDIRALPPQSPAMPNTIAAYNAAQTTAYKSVCDKLAAEIALGLPQAIGKIWHGGPVWFIADNPVVGYWVRKKGVQFLFWSGQAFAEPGLKSEGKFKAAETYYTDAAHIHTQDVQRWLAKAANIQWDYQNIVKRRGVLLKIGDW
jgi:hypothetical protein